jgi:ADP-ribosylglycohydrolase
MTQGSVVGSLLGTAVGDAIGLPYEGLSRQRAARLWGEPDAYHLLPRRGMVSDDTEHSCMVAQALICSGGDPDRFTKSLANGLRLWILGAPAGVGLATLRATLRLWIGFPPARSGVFSAGNGPAMRSPLIGAALDDLSAVKRFVQASTRLTHRDPKAEHGALTVSLAAYLASRETIVEGAVYLKKLKQFIDPDGEELVGLVCRAVDSAERSESTPDFAESLGLSRGVTGYVYHTVPVAVHAWLRHQDNFRLAITEIVRCGGDTDTTGAIVGGIVGAAVGKDGIPPGWLAGLWEWPRTIDWMQQLAGQLHAAIHSGGTMQPIRLPAYGVLPRNLLFLAIVLAHGFRRLLPPY